MEDQNIYEYQPEPNIYNNYFSQTENNFDLNQGRNITNQAKQMIRTFKNQYLNNNNARVLSTDANQMSQKYPSYQNFPPQKKEKEDLNLYDYYFNTSRDITPIRKRNYNENTQQTYNIMSQENIKLKRQIKDLSIENKNLKNKINNRNVLSPIVIKDNNLSYILSNNRQNPLSKEDSDNNIIFYNNNVLSNDKKFSDESIDSIAKANKKLGQNNINIKRIHSGSYGGNKFGYLRKNKNYNNLNINLEENNPNPNYLLNNLNQNINNDINNNNEYLSIKNDYNKLLIEYKNTKRLLEN